MLDNKKFTEEVQETRKKEVEKKVKKIGSINPHRGHTLFSVNKKTFEIKKAEFKKEDFVMHVKEPNRRVDVEEDCLYIPALNKKNLLKKLKREFPDSIEEIITKNK